MGHIAVAEEKVKSLIGTSEIESDWLTDVEEIAGIL